MSDQSPGSEPPILPPERGQGPVPFSPPPMSPPQEFASNYPRQGQTAFQYVRPPGVYWDSLGTAVSMISSNWSVYALSSLIGLLLVGLSYIPFFIIVLGGIGAMASGGKRLQTAAPLVMLGPQLLLQVVAVFITLCVICVGVKHAQGNAPTVEDFFIPFKRFGKSSLACLLAASPLLVLSTLSAIIQTVLGSSQLALVAVAGLVTIFSGLVYVACYGTLLMSATASVFTDLSPIAAATKAFRTLGWNSVMFGLLTALGGFLSGLGVIACCVGVLISYPVLPNIVALHYIYCFPPEPVGLAESGVPTSTYL